MEALSLPNYGRDGHGSAREEDDAMIITEKTETRRYATLRLMLVADEPSRLSAKATCQSEVLGEPISETLDFKIRAHEMRDAYDTIRSVAQRGPSRRSSTALLDPIKDVGARLFNGLFQNQLGRVYRESVLLADERGSRLRICISATPGTLVEDLPWEFLFDPLRNDFLALSSRRPILRQVPTNAPVSEPSDSLRIAFLTSPDPDQRLEVDRDGEILQQIASIDSRRVKITEFGPVTAELFLKVMTSDEFDVVHFSGHATEQTPGGVLSSQSLVLQGLGGIGTDLMSVDVLARALPQPGGPRLLFLNACNTHRFAQRLAGYVPNVIGMRDLVSIDFCTTFANGFYRALLKGLSVEEAVAAARELSDTVNPGGREWGMAALCTGDRSPAYFTSFAQPFERQLEKADVSPALSDPGREREWKKLSQLLEINRRNFAALQDVLKNLNETEGLGEAVRTINQGAVLDIGDQISKLSQTIADIEHRMHDLLQRP